MSIQIGTTFVNLKQQNNVKPINNIKCNKTKLAGTCVI